jgi:hypothetical protein
VQPPWEVELADAIIAVDAPPDDLRHLRWFFGAARPPHDGPGENVGENVGDDSSDDSSDDSGGERHDVLISVADGAVAAGNGEPTSVNGPIERWEGEAGHTTLRHASGRGATVSPDEIVIGATTVDEPTAWRSIRQLLAEALAVWFGTRGDVVLHASLVARGDDALLALGPTGSGKSTVAAAAFAAGWNVHSDDLTIVRRVGDTARAYGIPKRPNFDPTIAGGLNMAVTPATGDPRGRVAASASEMTAGWTSLRATVALDHSSGDGGMSRLERPDVLHAVIAATFAAGNPAYLARQLGTLAFVAALPAFRLELAVAADIRLAATGRALVQIFDEAGVDPAAIGQ